MRSRSRSRSRALGGGGAAGLRCLSLAALALAGAGGSAAHAAVVININQVGTNVVAVGSGTVNLAGFIFTTPNPAGSGIAPALGAMLVGPVSVGTGDFYTAVTGPTTFGSGAPMSATSGAGDLFGVFGFIGTTGILGVPAGYVSGASLSGSAFFANQSLDSLGVTPGTYVYTWGAGPTADSLTLRVPNRNGC